jgi:hypothetical protein
MNKNKLVLVIILGLIGIFIVWIILNLNSDKTQTGNQTKSVAEFNIWLFND